MRSSITQQLHHFMKADSTVSVSRRSDCYQKEITWEGEQNGNCAADSPFKRIT